MKVLHVSHLSAPTPPPGYGGIQLLVDILARYQLRKGYHVKVVGVRNQSYAYEYEFHDIGIKEPIRKRRLSHKIWRVWHGLYSLLKSLDTDIVHLHAAYVVPFFILEKIFLDKVVLLTLHVDLWDSGLVPYIAKRSRLPLIAISHSQSSRMRAKGFNVVDTIYNGIEVEKYPFVKDKEDYLVFLGMIHRGKGAHIAVKVAKRLGEKLVIMGPIFDEGYFNEQIKPFLGENIRYMGEVDQITKIRYLSKAKALLYPVGYEEFFGIVLVESLACGTPVIAFSRGSVPEIIQHGVNGYLAHSEEEMARYVNHIEKIEPGQCRKTVEERFSAEAMASRYMQLYDSLIKFK